MLLTYSQLTQVQGRTSLVNQKSSSLVYVPDELSWIQLILTGGSIFATIARTLHRMSCPMGLQPDVEFLHGTGVWGKTHIQNSYWQTWTTNQVNYW